MSDSSKEIARRIRCSALRMVHAARASHIGACFSAADVLAVLYESVMRIDPKTPDHPNRDRLVVSKGHAAAVLYAVLAEKGFFRKEELETYSRDMSRLAGHASSSVPGVEVSTGSLGHGLSIACGFALAGVRDRKDYRVFALLSDGELNEGSIWEAVMFAVQQKLSNLTAIVDRNGMQALGRTETIMDLSPVSEKWRAFGWDVLEVDGHDHDALLEALAERPNGRRPLTVIANTVKGHGVKFMENQLAWHYKSPNSVELAAALAELGEAP